MIYFQGFCVVLGGFIISLVINYLADVLPIYRKLVKPKCTSCDQPINWLDYFSGKRCRKCGRKIKIRYWTILVVCPILALIIWLFPPSHLPFPIAMILLAYLALIAIIDLEHRLILHITSLAGAILCLPIGILWTNNQGNWGQAIGNTLIGGAAGFGILFGLYMLGIGFTKLMSKMRNQTIEEEAMGFGDVTLAGVLGLLLGWPKIAINIIGTIILAGIFSLLFILVRLIMKKYQAFQPIPYGPFLIIIAALLIYSA